MRLVSEPNTTAQGLGVIWADDAAFADRFTAVLGRYRAALPGVRCLYPGLSPGSSVKNVRQDHIDFIEASRKAAEAAAGIGLHVYWSNVSPLQKALDTVDDLICRFGYKPLWVAEAANNKPGAAPADKARQYLQFWRELQNRPTVQGVAFWSGPGMVCVHAKDVRR